MKHFTWVCVQLNVHKGWMCKYTFEHSAALKNVMTALKQDEICLVIKLWDSLIRCVFLLLSLGHLVYHSYVLCTHLLVNLCTFNFVSVMFTLRFGLCTLWLASFPGPTQLSVSCSTKSGESLETRLPYDIGVWPLPPLWKGCDHVSASSLHPCTQLHVLTSQFVTFIPCTCAIRAWIEEFRHVNWSSVY